MKHRLFVLGLTAVALGACLWGCAEQQPPVNRVEAYALPKTLFQGEWYYSWTVIDNRYTGTATDTLSTYKIPDILSVPEIEGYFLEDADNPNAVMRSKAIGEPPLMYGIGAYFALLDAMRAFRQECREFAEHWLDVQREEFKRLGVTGNWADPYLTMDYHAEAVIAGEFMTFLMNGTLYQGSKPVMWSPVEKTALAEAEVEYHDHQSHTIWVKFRLLAGREMRGVEMTGDLTVGRVEPLGDLGQSHTQTLQRVALNTCSKPLSKPRIQPSEVFQKNRRNR